MNSGRESNVFTPEEIIEAFSGIVESKIASEALDRYRSNRNEAVRLHYLTVIIDSFSDLQVNLAEGGITPSKIQIIQAAVHYSEHTADTTVLDAADAKMRQVAESIVRTQNVDAETANMIIEIKQELEAQGFAFGNTNQGEDIDVSTD